MFEKTENKQKRGQGWPIFKKNKEKGARNGAFKKFLSTQSILTYSLVPKCCLDERIRKGTVSVVVVVLFLHARARARHRDLLCLHRNYAVKVLANI